jgi:hypothetical protein
VKGPNIGRDALACAFILIKAVHTP